MIVALLVVNRREHRTRSIVTSKTKLCTSHCQNRRSAQLSFWYTPAMMPSKHQTTKSESGAHAHVAVLLPRGSRRFLLFFLVHMGAEEAEERAAFICSSSFLLSSSSSTLRISMACARRYRRVEESTCSPDAPASTGRLRVGRHSPEECRRLLSLSAGPGSARMPGRSPGGGVFCARGS